MEQTKKLTKFKTYNNKVIYLDLSKADSIGEVDNTYHLNQQNHTTLTGTTYTVPELMQTNISIGQQQYQVTAHLYEVLALLEGRDSLPAQVLYGRKNKED